MASLRSGRAAAFEHGITTRQIATDARTSGSSIIRMGGDALDLDQCR
jgi:hypothetical protein